MSLGFERKCSGHLGAGSSSYVSLLLDTGGSRMTAPILSEDVEGVIIIGKCVGLRKRTITPKPNPETGEVKPSFEKYELVVEAKGQSYEIGYGEERDARAAAGRRHPVTGHIEVEVFSARGGAGGRVYWNGGGASGAGGDWLDLDA